MKNLLIITQKVDKNDQLLGFFVGWIARLAKKFDKITILCLEKGEFNLPSNVKVLSLGKDRGAGKLKQLFIFYSLFFTLRNDYDAVFVHMNPIWVVLGGWFWRLVGKKIFFWYTSGGVTAKLKLAEKFADIILTASKESFRLQSKKVVVTGHGIDTELFKPINEQRPATNNNKIKILSVGRISPVKNYEVLVEAAKILADKGADFSITMIGESAIGRDKEYEKKLKLKIKNLKLENHFNFIGKINNRELVSFYQNHDIFVHLSKTGSVDKVLLEAIACGMNVLSSSDSARNFLPSELVFEENNARELADKIEETYKKNFGSQLRQYVVENHNLDKLIDKIMGIVKRGC